MSKFLYKEAVKSEVGSFGGYFEYDKEGKLLCAMPYDPRNCGELKYDE